MRKNLKRWWHLPNLITLTTGWWWCVVVLAALSYMTESVNSSFVNYGKIENSRRKVPEENRYNDDNILNSEDKIEDTIERIVNNTRRIRNEEEDLTLITFLQKAVKSYGQKKVAKSIYELAQKDLYDLIWMLAGELDTYLIFDLYNVYSAAQTDPKVLSVYERFRAGNVNRTIVPEVFALDKKYDQYAWWKRVRVRMLNSVDKYMAGQLDINGRTSPPIEYDKDGKVIIAGVKIPESGLSTTSRNGLTRATTDPSNAEELDSDEELLEFLNLD